MDTACGLVDKFRDLVLDRIWEQLLYMINYHRNIEQLNERLVELTLERSSIQHRIDEATNNAEQIQEKVLHWLHKVDEISEHVQSLHEEESQAETECSITSCPNPWLRYKLSKRAKAMAQEVAEMCEKGNFDRLSYRVPRPLMSDERIGSRVPIMDQIVEALQNPSVNMVGLCGLGGVGKTTIAKEVAKNQNMFERVIMTTVSAELDVEKIQCQIAEKLGMQLNEKTEDVRASRLRERLKQEKNMLLILDDLWEELDLAKVGIPFLNVGNYSKTNEGCKILLTSRNEMLLSNRMKCQKIIKVGVLSEDEALELFKKIAELPIDSSSFDLMSIANEIVRKCGGLPLAIATAAKVLRGKDLNDWKDYRARLNNPLRRSITRIEEVDHILKLSYDHLGFEQKYIFLLAAMLSNDSSIEDMLMFSVGLDILEGIENMEDAHIGISAIISKLKSLNLFFDSFSSHRFTMHDVLRDLALSIASDELKAFIVRHRRLHEWPDENMLEGNKGICLQETDICDLPEELHGSKLEFFLLNSTKRDLTIPNLFFKSSKKLKVLAFANMHISLLPSLSSLEKLKTLCLHSCLLEDITEIGRLKNLKVLSLAYSEIQQLPIELAELTSLQMLNLSHCSELKVIPQKLLSSLKKLEVLYMGYSYDQWKVEGSNEANENVSLDELKDLPISSLDIQIRNVSMLPENLFLDMNLKRYRIFIGRHWEWQGNESSRTLKIELEHSIHMKRGVQKLLEGVQDLYLYGSNGIENVLHSHDGRGFPFLRHLQIESIDDIKYDVLNSAHHEAAVTNNTSNKIFESLFKKVLLPKLEILKLSNLNRLITLIWDDQLSHSSFMNLKTLIVKSCGFVKLMPLHVLKSLNNLEELEIRDCDMLEIVFDFEDLNDSKEKESSSGVVPLQKLMLQNLPKLKNVWSNYCLGNVSFQSLKSVDVSFCKSLTSIFPASIANGMLGDLEELQMVNCGIEVIVAKDQVSESVSIAFEFPKLTSLELSGLSNLRNFYPQRHTLECPHLQRLSIQCCDELELFEKEISNSSNEEGDTLGSKYPLLSYHKVIYNLEELSLWGKEAEMIVGDEFPMYHFPKVRLLCLGVEKATTISYRSLLKRFPNLEELRLDGDFKEAFGEDHVASLAYFNLLSKLTLKNISNMISLAPNLTHLEVTLSNWLITLMISSIARSLVHLTCLSIGSCSQIEEIITKQEGEDDEDREIYFNKLEFLKLDRLPRLKRFCGHSYTFMFPLLKQLIISKCPKFRIFSPGLIDTPSLESVQLLQDSVKRRQFWDTNLNKTIYHQRFVVSTKLVLNENDASMIRNIDQFPADRCAQVEILRIERIVDEGVTLPYTFLQRFPQLFALHVEHSSFEEIFPSQQDQIVDQILPAFTELYLADLDQLKNIWGDDSQLSPIQNLEILHVENCSNLINLAPSPAPFDNLIDLKVFKCDQLAYLVTNSTARRLVNLETLEINYCEKLEEIVAEEINDSQPPPIHEKLKFLQVKNCCNLVKLAPSSASFDNLTVLKVSRCHQLVYLLTNSTAKSLVSLETLEVNDCEQMEEIVNKETIEDVEGGITFNGMRILKLTLLPRLKIEEDRRYFNIEDRATNIFRSLFGHNKVLLPKLEILELSSLNRLIPMIWDDRISHNSFMNLKTLIVKSCGLVKLMSLHVLKSLNNLEELEVRRCEMLEIVFDLEDLNGSKEMMSPLMVVPLKKLTLWQLPKLKNVWINDPKGIISFQCLSSIDVSFCESLTSVLPASMAKGMLRDLEELHINKCGIDSIVAKDQVSDFVAASFEFPRLIFLKLSGLPNLRNFF